MGRRPNQLVLEFFQRGQKLPDASNRYEHSCKRCGEAVCMTAGLSHICVGSCLTVSKRPP